MEKFIVYYIFADMQSFTLIPSYKFIEIRFWWEFSPLLISEMQQYLNSPAMNMYKKRERTQNWNHQEKKFLLDLCRKDMRIIENKRLDAGLTAVKNKAWKIIHQKFSNQFGTDRTCNRLKEQWRRMKGEFVC